LAVLCVFALDFVFPSLLPWTLLAIPGLWLCMVLLAIFFLFIYSLFCYGKTPPEKDGGLSRKLALTTMDCILTLYRVKPVGVNLEGIPEGPCIIVSNHLSRFDPMVKSVLLKGRLLSFVSKKENMRIPIAGPVLQKIGYVSLDRENPLRAMRAIHKGAKYISEFGYTVGIYPEGTRSRNGELLDFKTGAFVMAKKAKCPVVITTIEGTFNSTKNLPFHSTKAVFTVLRVIPAETVVQKKPEELAEICRSVISDALS
jgi:1-acyl-sn-glycerol-3-phosphate acyltransferase